MSDIKCECSTCGAKYRLPAEYQGRSARCKKCGNKFQVPAQEEKSLEDSVLDWLKEPEGEDEVVEQPRVVSMPKKADADSSDPGVKRGPIRLKSNSSTPESH